MRLYSVIITKKSAKDMQDIHNYIFDYDSPEKACYVTDEIEKVIRSLATFPERGSYPPEMLKHDRKEFREVYFKPYRIIYMIEERKVAVHMVVDGRRDLQKIIVRRLLG